MNYADRSEWAKFITDYIIPLRDSTLTLVDFRNYLKEERLTASNLTIEIEKDENLKTILLGGVKENGDYSERSLALFYSKFFGARLSNLQEYLLYQKEDVTSPVTVVVEENEFMKFVRSISEKTNAILDSAYQNGLIDVVDSETLEIDFDALIIEPEKVAELIKDFYDKTLKITANYNQHTLFLWTIRKITRRYLEAAYPELKEEEKFEALKSILGLEKYFVPGIEERTENDKKVKRDYTIWHLPENSFWGLICGLNEIVWGYLERETFRGDLEFLFTSVVDLKKDFKEKAERAINNWKFPEYIVKTHTTNGHYKYTYLISGLYIPKYRLTSRSWSGSWGSDDHKCNIWLPKLLDDLSPGLFLGLMEPNKFIIEDNVLEILE